MSENDPMKEQLDPNKRTVETWLQLIDSKISNQNREIAKLEADVKYLTDAVTKVRGALWKVIGISVGLGIIMGYVFNEFQDLLRVVVK